MKSEIVGVGIRMPKGLHKELRKLSFEKEISLNRLLVMGAIWVSQQHLESESVESLPIEQFPEPEKDVWVHPVPDAPAKRRRKIADAYLEGLYQANPHYRGISMKKRNFLNSMFGIKPISERQLDYLVGICSDYVSINLREPQTRDKRGSTYGDTAPNLSENAIYEPYKPNGIS